MVAPWKLDKNSEKLLAGVRPDLQHVVRKAVEISPIHFAIVSGSRTQAQQDALYAQGRWKPGLIVTWTRHSRHIGGHAVDYGIMKPNGKINWHDLEPYKKLGPVFKAAALLVHVPIEWGGDWKKTPDWGHVQLRVR